MYSCENMVIKFYLRNKKIFISIISRSYVEKKTLIFLWLLSFLHNNNNLRNYYCNIPMFRMLRKFGVQIIDNNFLARLQQTSIDKMIQRRKSLFNSGRNHCKHHCYTKAHISHHSSSHNSSSFILNNNSNMLISKLTSQLNKTTWPWTLALTYTANGSGKGIAVYWFHHRVITTLT